MCGRPDGDVRSASWKELGVVGGNVAAEDLAEREVPELPTRLYVLVDVANELVVGSRLTPELARGKVVPPLGAAAMGRRTVCVRQRRNPPFPFLISMAIKKSLLILFVLFSVLTFRAGTSQADPLVSAGGVQTSTTGEAQLAASSSSSPVIGISIPNLVSQTSATQAAWLANLKSIGVTSVRIDANWGWVMYAGAKFHQWSRLDREVASIRAAGMTAELIIDGCPRWAAVHSAAGQLFAQPAKASEFAAWAAAVVARYAPEGVTDYEIWNEPNNSVFWKPAPDPSAYTADLKAAYAAIKAVDRSALVISGGLAPEANEGGNINEVTFLQDMFADGAKGSFDALGDHPYSYPALPNTYEVWSGWSAIDQTPTSLERVLAANGSASTPMWITEVGAPSEGPDGIGAAGQAKELTQVIADVRHLSWIKALYIYTYEDSGSNPGTDEDWFGLLNANGSHKPAFAAVAAAIGSIRRSSGAGRAVVDARDIGPIETGRRDVEVSRPKFDLGML